MPARSESFLSLKSGLQAALWQLGKAPQICQTDNSSTATHQLRRGKKERGFNEAYLNLFDHYGMKAASTNVPLLTRMVMWRVPMGTCGAT